MANFTRTLSPRLQLIFDQLLPGRDVWDLCCDHGLVGLKAAASEDFCEVHFVDQAAHLVEALRRFQPFLPQAYFHPFSAQELTEPLCGNVVATGVGAELISKIVRSLLLDGRLQADRLILGPHKDEEKLQEWLCQDLVFSESYSLLQICAVRERGRLREIFVFQRRSEMRRPLN